MKLAVAAVEVEEENFVGRGNVELISSILRQHNVEDLRIEKRFETLFV